MDLTTWVWLLVGRWLPDRHLISVHFGCWTAWVKRETIRGRGWTGCNPQPSNTTSSAKMQGYHPRTPEHSEVEKGNALPITYYFLKNLGKFISVLNVNVGWKLREKKNSSSPHWWILHFSSLKGLLCFQCTQHTSISVPFLMFAWHGQRFLRGPRID